MAERRRLNQLPKKEMNQMEDGGTTGMRLTEGPKFHQDLRMKEWKDNGRRQCRGHRGGGDGLYLTVARGDDEIYKWATFRSSISRNLSIVVIVSYTSTSSAKLS